MDPSRKLLLAALTVFAVALALRGAHLAALEASWDGTQLFSLARGDASHHWREAQDILDREPLLLDRVPWKGPGYSYFLAGLMRLVGREPGALRWPLAILGALNCAGLVWLARRMLPLRWSVVAGLLAAGNGVLILFDGELLFPTLLISLSLAAMLLLTRPSRGPGATAAAGALLGLAALVHPVYLLPAGLLTLWLARGTRRGAMVFAAGVALVVAPLTAKNMVARGQPVLISWSGGINLYLGNQPAFDQTSGQGTAAWSRVLNTPEEAGLAREIDRDRHYYRLALRRALASPGQALDLLFHKVRVLLSPVEIANNVRLYELREASPIVRATLARVGPLYVPFGLWLPAVLLGVWSHRRRRGDPGLPAASPPSSALAGVTAAWSLGLCLSIVLSFNTARYRAPLVFFGCIWASLALAVAWQRLRTVGIRGLVPDAPIYVALAIWVALLVVPQRTLPPPLEWSQTQVFEAEGRIDLATRWLERGLARNAGDPLLQLEAARFYGRRGDRKSERAWLDAVLSHPDLEPDLRVFALETRAHGLLAQGDQDGARQATQAALAVDADRCVWKGRPCFWMDLAPVTRCRLELLMADIELRAQNPRRALRHVEEVRRLCPTPGGALAQRFRELEIRTRGVR